VGKRGLNALCTRSFMLRGSVIPMNDLAHSHWLHLTFQRLFILPPASDPVPAQVPRKIRPRVFPITWRGIQWLWRLDHPYSRDSKWHTRSGVKNPSTTTHYTTCTATRDNTAPTTTTATATTASATTTTTTTATISDSDSDNRQCSNYNSQEYGCI
jgi:hypothetical protein